MLLHVTVRIDLLKTGGDRAYVATRIFIIRLNHCYAFSNGPLFLLRPIGV